jgi:hypothetical protein
MVARVTEAGTQNYIWVRRLRSLRDRVDLASGHCMSNLAVIHSIRQSRKAEVESNNRHTLSSVEGTIESCVKNSHLLKCRIDNTIDLVSFLRTFLFFFFKKKKNFLV